MGVSVPPEADDWNQPGYHRQQVRWWRRAWWRVAIVQGTLVAGMASNVALSPWPVWWARLLSSLVVSGLAWHAGTLIGNCRAHIVLHQRELAMLQDQAVIAGMASSGLYTNVEEFREAVMSMHEQPQRRTSRRRWRS